MTRTERQIEQYRQGPTCIEVRDAAGRPCAGVPVWVEQETHAFVFGCVAPDLEALPAPDRARCAARLHEVFNRLLPAEAPSDPEAMRLAVPCDVYLGRFRLELDRLASAGLPLDIYVDARSASPGAAAAGYGDSAAAKHIAGLYTLCFAHPDVRAIIWDGFWDGEARVADHGLLRRDFAPRPAFRYLHKLIDVVWHTRASGETDQDGQFRFRGFFGDYRVAAQVGEAATTARAACHAPDAPSPFVLHLPAWPTRPCAAAPGNPEV